MKEVVRCQKKIKKKKKKAFPEKAQK